MTSKLQFLAQHPLFKYLDEEELEELADIAEELEYQDGTVVAYQGDVADCLIMVKSGRLYAETVERGIVTHTRDYRSNQYLGLDWVFTPTVHPATIRTAAGNERSTRLVIFSDTALLYYLSQNEHVIDDLEPEYDQTENLVGGFPEDVYKEALKIKAKRDRRSNTMNILADELIEYNSRRSGWYLFVQLLPPIILFFFIPLLPYMLLNNFSNSQPVGSILYNLQFYCPALLSLLFIFWAIFRFFDWTNDYFIITSRRVIHREFSLRTFRVDIKIARIDQIQSVSIDKPTLLANMLKYGTARITTASQFGVILFDSISSPTEVKTTLDRLTRQVKTLDASREQTMVRKSIEDYFQLKQGYTRIGEEGETAVTDAKGEPIGLWTRFYRRYQWRIEEDGVITYRKHFLIAAAALLWPMILAGVIALLAYLTLRFNVISYQFVYPVLVIVYIFIFAWIVWRVEDWRNDLFRLTDRLIIDIDRMPFGFGESSKQAELQNIQNVRAYTPGLIHTIFNYGFVEVETAGVDSNIKFENIPFPGVVQSDIFHQIEDFNRRQREAEEARRHKAFAVLLDVYKQEEEQGRLPRRTPPDLTWEDLDELEDWDEEEIY